VSVTYLNCFFDAIPPKNAYFQPLSTTSKIKDLADKNLRGFWVTRARNYSRLQKLQPISKYIVTLELAQRPDRFSGDLVSIQFSVYQIDAQGSLENVTYRYRKCIFITKLSKCGISLVFQFMKEKAPDQGSRMITLRKGTIELVSLNGTVGIAVYYQIDEKGERKINRFDGGLFKMQTEQMETATKRECRAALEEKHRHMTVKRKVFVHTDHRALAYYSENRIITPKVHRWRQRILDELDIEIQYRPGSGIMVDGLTNTFRPMVIYQCFSSNAFITARHTLSVAVSICSVCILNRPPSNRFIFLSPFSSI